MDGLELCVVCGAVMEWCECPSCAGRGSVALPAKLPRKSGGYWRGFQRFQCEWCLGSGRMIYCPNNGDQVHRVGLL